MIPTLLTSRLPDFSRTPPRCSASKRTLSSQVSGSESDVRSQRPAARGPRALTDCDRQRSCPPTHRHGAAVARAPAPPDLTRALQIYSLDHVMDLLRKSQRVLVLTGAGISVSAGIPDFRGANGICKPCTARARTHPHARLTAAPRRREPEGELPALLCKTAPRDP
jgi:hypothetical protein